MEKKHHKKHPYHYSVDKNLFQKLIDWAVPIGFFLLYYNLYNFGKFSPPEMIKTTGLMAIALLSLTLMAGPIARFFPSLDMIKAHRTFWGITSFLFLVLHLILVVIVYFKLDILALFNTQNPHFPGLITGVIAFIVLFIVTLTSHKSALKNLDPHVWKAIQSASYIALILAVLHFYLMEQVEGALVIKRFLGRVTYWFATAVILLRLIVLFLPKTSKK